MGGTDLYYKEGWAPREVYKDCLGPVLTVLKCKMSVRSGGRGLRWASVGRHDGLTWVQMLDKVY
jgi:hypothetical protein